MDRSDHRDDPAAAASEQMEVEGQDNEDKDNDVAKTQIVPTTNGDKEEDPKATASASNAGQCRQAPGAYAHPGPIQRTTGYLTKASSFEKEEEKRKGRHGGKVSPDENGDEEGLDVQVEFLD